MYVKKKNYISFSYGFHLWHFHECIKKKFENFSRNYFAVKNILFAALPGKWSLHGWKASITCGIIVGFFFFFESTLRTADKYPDKQMKIWQNDRKATHHLTLTSPFHFILIRIFCIAEVSKACSDTHLWGSLFFKLIHHVMNYFRCIQCTLVY